MTVEVTTVADDEVVVFDRGVARRYDSLAPGTEHDLDGIAVTTLERPGGELLCRFATVNDVHFGELECGVLPGFPDGPVFRAEPGDAPYPEAMNRAAIAEIAAIEPHVVVAKGDLTDRGTAEEYAAFLACYEPAFGERLLHVRGNHDAANGATFAAWPTQTIDLPGVRLAVLDTALPPGDSGRVTSEQLGWLDDMAGTAEAEGVAVMVLGHHHPWDPLSRRRDEGYFGINPRDSERLVDVISRRPSIVGYLAGHTHRNRVRRFASSGAVPYVEVACVKDFPGTWAEYRVYEGGILQIHRRISSDAALAWSEKTRAMYGGLYTAYALGALADRCFAFPAPRFTRGG
ncbi:MAG: metallophosphoesterase family protein [Acidimicrobiales bacterium]